MKNINPSGIRARIFWGLLIPAVPCFSAQDARQYLEVTSSGIFDFKTDVTGWVPGESFFDLAGYYFLWSGETSIDYEKGYAVLEIDKRVVGVDLTLEESGELSVQERKRSELAHHYIDGALTVKIDTYYWGNLAQLRQVIALDGRLSDKYLKRLKNRTILKGLWLKGEGITDKGLSYLRGLTNLSELSLEGTGITDSGLVNLASLTRLRELSLEGANISGVGFKYLFPLFRLAYIDLSGSNFTDDGLAFLASFQNLKELNLEGTQITDHGLSSLEGLVNLAKLNLKNTQVKFGSDATRKLQMALPSCYILF